MDIQKSREEEKRRERVIMPSREEVRAKMKEDAEAFRRWLRMQALVSREKIERERWGW